MRGEEVGREVKIYVGQSIAFYMWMKRIREESFVSHCQSGCVS